MAQAKIEVKFGDTFFSGEGDSAWLESQLDKILGSALNGTEGAVPDQDDGASKKPKSERSAPGSLASFLRAMKATTNQVRKFLATAHWLDVKGEGNLKTSLVTKALADNRQTKLTNPAHCLNQNVRKGYCEKRGKEFFVTEEGVNSLEPTVE
jgi:hypothetical protein